MFSKCSKFYASAFSVAARKILNDEAELLRVVVVGQARQVRRALVQLTDRDFVAGNRRIKQLSDISNRPAAASLLSFVMFALPIRSPIATSCRRHHTAAGIILRFMVGMICSELPHLSWLPLCISGRKKLKADLIVGGR